MQAIKKVFNDPITPPVSLDENGEEKGKDKKKVTRIFLKEEEKNRKGGRQEEGEKRWGEEWRK